MINPPEMNRLRKTGAPRSSRTRRPNPVHPAGEGFPSEHEAEFITCNASGGLADVGRPFRIILSTSSRGHFLPGLHAGRSVL